MTSFNSLRIIKCFAIIPITSDIILDAFVVLKDNIVIEYGKYSYFYIKKIYGGGIIEDYSSYIIMPSLVNAHIHIDQPSYTQYYNNQSAKLSFVKWLRMVIKLNHSSSLDYIANNIKNNILLIKKYGTGAIGNIDTHNISSKYLYNSKIFTRNYFEFISPVNSNSKSQFNKFIKYYNSIGVNKYIYKSISPHSLYSVSYNGLKLISDFILKNNIKSSIHIAESDSEYDMFLNKKGDLFNLIYNLDSQIIKKNLVGGNTPVEYLHKLGILRLKPLLIHLNKISNSDLDILKDYNLSVVHCPISHRFFNHSKFEFFKLKDINIMVCLGTDSLLSNNSLNLFDEMREFSINYKYTNFKDILDMVTINPSKALGFDSLGIGYIQKGKQANFILLKTNNSFIMEIKKHYHIINNRNLLYEYIINYKDSIVYINT